MAVVASVVPGHARTMRSPRPRGTPPERRSHPVLVLAASIAALMLTGIGLAAPASAHASLLFTSPAAGTAIASSPTAIVLVFDEHIAVPAGAVTVTKSTSRSPIGLRQPTLSQGGTTLTAALNSTLGPGTYTVAWQVVSADGDNVAGSYQFAVGTVATGALSAGTGTTTGADWWTAAARWVQFLALALLLGEAALARVVRRLKPPPAATPRPWTRAAAAGGLLGSLVVTGLICGNGNLATALTHPSLAALSSRPGLTAIIESAAFAVALLLSLRWYRWAWLPGLAVVVAEASRAHPGAYAGTWGRAITAAHLAAASIWVGALVPVVRYVRAARVEADDARAVLFGYVRLGAWSFAVLVLTGTLASLTVVTLATLTSTSYGWTLLLKLGLVAVVAILALRSHLQLRRGASELRLIRAEAVLLIVILAVSATLTATPPPRTITTALLVPPPAAGPVAYLGNRTGQIGVTLAASAGQAVIRLFAPGTDEAAAAANARYRLAATLAAPGRPVTALSLRGCGPGCFAAVARWRAGTNQLTLRASSRGWAGGTVTLSVPWPPHPDPAALTRLAEVLRHTGAMIDYERVTSNTVTGPGFVTAIPITGPAFLAVEPYSSGRAGAVNAVLHADGTSTIQIAFPDQNIYAELELDRSGRPVHETLTDPNHLITRSFTYPAKR